ncbi:MAG: trypsin-like serine protease, partial [Myxococcota bacterium]
WVLTAAHCIDTGGPEVGAIAVYFGADARQEQDPNFVHLGQAVSATMHEGWVPTGAPDQGNDVALIELAEAAPIQPIPMNRTPMSQDMLGASVRLVGWGLTSGSNQDSGLKRAADSQLFDYADDRVNVGNGITNTCMGDSGGPAFMNINGQTVVMGVTSYGDVDCQQTGISMRVDAFAEWADGVMGNATPGNGGNPGNGGADQCTSGDECAGGVCVDGGNGAFCTEQCNSDNDCQAGWACFTTGDPNLNVCAPDGDGGGDDGNGGDGGNNPGNLPGVGGPAGGGSGSGVGGGGGSQNDDRYDDEDEEEAGGCSVTTTAPTPLAFGLLILGLLARRRRN